MKAKRRRRILYPRSTLTPTPEGRKIDDVLDSHSREIAEHKETEMPHDLYQTRGPQLCGTKCPDCHHDWARHYGQRGCHYLVGGSSGDDLCECLEKVPVGMRIPYIGSDDVLRVETVTTVT